MNQHLVEISANVSPGAIAFVVFDGAGSLERPHSQGRRNHFDRHAPMGARQNLGRLALHQLIGA
jgi:hypothetical protein